MKKVNKSGPPDLFREFETQYPNASWRDFSDYDEGKAYKEAKKRIFEDQGQLCAYCETRIESSPEQSYLQRIEHFHEKSDNTNTEKNWTLDWANLIGVCKGGSGGENKNSDGTSIFPTPENLSCDAFKGHLVVKGVLPAGCEGKLINPLLLSASPSLFKFDRQTGMLEPNDKFCDEFVVEDNKCGSVKDLVEQTIEVLNLNCDRLNKQRLEVSYEHNRLLKKAREMNNKEIFEVLAERWFRHHWPSFFTTRRILLGPHAEMYLQRINYDG